MIVQLLLMILLWIIVVIAVLLIIGSLLFVVICVIDIWFGDLIDNQIEHGKVRKEWINEDK